ncbi:hypothetical protein [Paenibacillus oceani]|uniref:Uncharacterized protein n=1 Tax=Paenibacillus oceani TaxID=2772510 RepID=A0A927H2Z6_9BACL|nr:hypothetical protein [Paenibacillus oceani]MBD2865893.1 hypothetical protein [Paenibacillus oceani]
MALVPVFGVASAVLSFILLSVLWIAGLLLCRKLSFRGGYYFFLFLLIGKIYSFLVTWVLSPILQTYMDSVNAASKPSFGMRPGELLMWISYANGSITYLFQLIAYGCLVIGFYRMWAQRKYDFR